MFFIPSELKPWTLIFKIITFLQNKALRNRAYLEVETVEELTDEYERGEKDLQSIYICSMSLTQVNSSLQNRRTHS